MRLVAVVAAALVLAGSAGAGVQPLAAAALGPRDVWVLAQSAVGVVLLRSTDAGRSFTRLAAPPVPDRGIEATLRFADRRDGFAYVPWQGGALFTTHDGGAHWRRQRLGTLLALATGGGNAYAVVGRCSGRGCGDYRLERSPVSRDAWSAQPLPFALGSPNVSLAARGSHVWLLGMPAGHLVDDHDLLARSRDGGRTFASSTGPCYADLGGRLLPTAGGVVWAVCPTGLLSGAWRSTDGGATFRPLKAPVMANSAALAPASATTAVLARNGAGARLLRTTDGGRSWRPAVSPAFVSASCIDFESARIGYALAGGLWRTRDGGAHWRAVQVSEATR